MISQVTYISVTYISTAAKWKVILILVSCFKANNLYFDYPRYNLQLCTKHTFVLPCCLADNTGNVHFMLNSQRHTCCNQASFTPQLNF